MFRESCHVMFPESRRVICRESRRVTCLKTVLVTLSVMKDEQVASSGARAMGGRLLIHVTTEPIFHRRRLLWTWIDAGTCVVVKNIVVHLQDDRLNLAANPDRLLYQCIDHLFSHPDRHIVDPLLGTSRRGLALRSATTQGLQIGRCRILWFYRQRPMSSEIHTLMVLAGLVEVKDQEAVAFNGTVQGEVEDGLVLEDLLRPAAMIPASVKVRLIQTHPDFAQWRTAGIPGRLQSLQRNSLGRMELPGRNGINLMVEHHLHPIPDHRRTILHLCPVAM